MVIKNNIALVFIKNYLHQKKFGFIFGKIGVELLKFSENWPSKRVSQAAGSSVALIAASSVAIAGYPWVKWTKEITPMNLKCALAAAILLPGLACAADPCSDSKTTQDMNQCISEQIAGAEKELARYLKESKRRVADDQKLLTLTELEKAQKAWRVFRKADCGAIYQYWSEGSVRYEKEGYCLLKQTRRRTHDLWEAYLTYVDSTPPILPEPKSTDNVKQPLNK